VAKVIVWYATLLMLLPQQIKSYSNQCFSQQEEAIPESVKNILLVMADSGHLTPPPFKDSDEEKIWTETKKRLDRFLPNLFNELFPVSEPPSTVSDKPDEESSEQATSNGNELSEKELPKEEEQSASPSPADVD
jgi:golgi-specific brefeldin A-resistance guanine nucleotide exchange factor 1